MRLQGGAGMNGIGTKSNFEKFEWPMGTYRVRDHISLTTVSFLNSKLNSPSHWQEK